MFYSTFYYDSTWFNIFSHYYLTWFCKNNLPWFNQGCFCLFKLRVLKRNFEAVVIKGWFYDLLLPELNFILIWIWILSSNFQLYTPEMIRFFPVARLVEMGLYFKNLIFYFSLIRRKINQILWFLNYTRSIRAKIKLHKPCQIMQ